MVLYGIKMKKEPKTTQLGLRIEVELLKKIEKLAEYEGIEKMAWIRRALANFVSDEEDGVADAAIEDYIALRIDEKELKDATGLKSIPEDLNTARKDTLKAIVKNRIGGK